MKMFNIFLLLATISIWLLPTNAVYIEGKATHMADGVMAGVVENRDLDLAGYVGAVALNRAGDRYRDVWLEWADGTVDGPFLVVDCAQRGEHFEAREEAGYIVEVSEKWAKRRGFAWVAPVEVTVWFVDPTFFLWRINRLE